MRAHLLAVFAFTLTVVLSVFATPVQAQNRCTIADVTSAYAKADALAKAKKYSAARAIWLPMAQAGFAPAQRRIAEAAISGRGSRKSKTDAAFWSGLAARSGDAMARQLFGEARLGMEVEAIRKLSERLDQWRPRGLACKGGKTTANTGAKFTYALSYHKRIPDQQRPGLRTNLDAVVKAAAAQEPTGRLMLSLIDGIELYPVRDNRYHRYVGWKADKGSQKLRLPVTSFNDKQPDFVVTQLLMVIKRRIYDALPDSELEDRTRRVIGGIEIFGSPYPDIRNRPFFDLISQALTMAERLPKESRQYLDILDAIYYNPASKHMVQEGTLDASAGYYNRGLSSEGNRIIFIRRDVLFGSALFMLRLLVHEGTHAVQDQKAATSYRLAQEENKALQNLKRDGKGSSAEAKRLQQRIDENIGYARRWYEGKQTANGRIQDIAFECEALINEIAVVRAIEGEPDMLNDSGYLRVCPDAQRELIKWKDEGLRAR